MKKLGFYYDMTRCVGCKTCQAACKDLNDLAMGDYFRRVTTLPVPYSASCNHCAEPACAEACPTGAMHKSDDGTVVHTKGLCIGCGACVWSCPYGAPGISSLTGTSQKCDACAALRREGKNPACVDACPTCCLEFGELDVLEQIHGPNLIREHPLIPDKASTKPSILIKAKGAKR